MSQFFNRVAYGADSCSFKSAIQYESKCHIIVSSKDSYPPSAEYTILTLYDARKHVHIDRERKKNKEGGRERDRERVMSFLIQLRENTQHQK